MTAGDPESDDLTTNVQPSANAGTRLVPLGKLVTTHGIKGWLKLKPYNPDTNNLVDSREVFLTLGATCSHRVLQKSKAFKNLFLVKLEGLDEIGKAEKWVGFVLSVEERGLQSLEVGEYYHYQVLGFDVFDTADHWVGTLTNVWSKDGGDVYFVKGTHKEYLVPAVREIIEKVDFPGRKIVINPPAGLFDL